MKVILCGPPRSGKSCLRDGLRNAVLRIPGAPYPYVITAAPDGEGAWYQQAASRDRATADALKAAYKQSFTPEFVERVANAVTQCVEPLTLIDVGGKITPENLRICSSASHAIILAGEPETIPSWRAFCGELGISVFAELASDHASSEDRLPSRDTDGVWRGSIHQLKRGVDAADRPTIALMAALLVQMARSEMDSVDSVTSGDGGELPPTSIRANVTIGAEGEPVLEIGFTHKPAETPTLVCEMSARIDELFREGILSGGPLLKINGPVAVPVAMVLGHILVHRYAAVAMYDPKIARYVVVSAHGPGYRLGDTIA